MTRRKKRKGDLTISGIRYPAEIRRYRRDPGRVITVNTYLPRPVAIKARREIYPYPYPKQRQKRGRVLRIPLRETHRDMVPVKVRIRLPRHLPLVRGSYVSLSRARLNIHSYNQVKGLIHAQEFNRRRYSEFKRHRRKGAHGQLDSRGSERFGSVAFAYRKGASIDQIADAALVARALGKGR